MTHRWAALITVLALCALAPNSAAGQASTTPPRQTGPTFELGQNYPNPFNPETTIPFSVGDPPTCTDQSHMYRVSIRIYNVLAQLVAIPILQGNPPGAAVTVTSAGQPLVNVMLPCGRYTAYWNGNYLNTGREAASGIYLYQLEVDGKSVVKKMIVMK